MGTTIRTDFLLKNFTKIDLSDVVNSTLDVEVAFRPNLNGYLEFRLCHVGEDLERDAVACRESDPILIGNEFPKIMFIPEPEQKNARLKLQMSLNESCSRCVIQAKLVPGTDAPMGKNLFFDCAPVVLTVPETSDQTLIKDATIQHKSDIVNSIGISSIASAVINKMDPFRNNFTGTLLTNVGRIIDEPRKSSEILSRDKSNTKQRSLVTTKNGAELSAEYTDKADFDLPKDRAYKNPATATLTDEYMSSNDKPKRISNTTVDQNDNKPHRISNTTVDQHENKHQRISNTTVVQNANKHGPSNRGVDEGDVLQEYFPENTFNRKSEINRYTAGNGTTAFNTDQSRSAAGSNEFTNKNLENRQLGDGQLKSSRPEENTALDQQLPSLNYQNESARRDDKTYISNSLTFKRRPGHLSLGFFGSSRNGEFSGIENTTAQNGNLKKGNNDTSLKTNIRVLNLNESSTVTLAGIDRHVKVVVQQPNTSHVLLSGSSQLLNNTVTNINNTEWAKNIIEAQPTSPIDFNVNAMLINDTDMILNTTDPSYLNVYNSFINATDWTTVITGLNNSSVDASLLTDWSLGTSILNATEWNNVTDPTSSEKRPHARMTDINHSNTTANTQKKDITISMDADGVILIDETQTSALIPTGLASSVSSEPPIISVAKDLPTATPTLTPLNAMNGSDYVYYNYYYDYPELNATTDPVIDFPNNNSANNIVDTEIPSMSNTSVRIQYSHNDNSSEVNVTIAERSNASIGNNLKDIVTDTERQSLNPLIDLTNSVSVNGIVGTGISSMSNTSVRIQNSHNDNLSEVNITVPEEINTSIDKTVMDIVTERRPLDPLIYFTNSSKTVNGIVDPDTLSMSNTSVRIQYSNKDNSSSVNVAVPKGSDNSIGKNLQDIITERRSQDNNHEKNDIHAEFNYSISVRQPIAYPLKDLKQDQTERNLSFNDSIDLHLGVEAVLMANHTSDVQQFELPVMPNSLNVSVENSVKHVSLTKTVDLKSDSTTEVYQITSETAQHTSSDKHITNLKDSVTSTLKTQTNIANRNTRKSTFQMTTPVPYPMTEPLFNFDMFASTPRTMLHVETPSVVVSDSVVLTTRTDYTLKANNSSGKNTTSKTHRFAPLQPNNTLSKDMSTVSSPTERNVDFFFDNSIQVDNNANFNSTSTANRVLTARHNNTRPKDMSTVSSPTERNVDFIFDNSIKVDNTANINSTSTANRFLTARHNNTRPKDMSTVSSPTERNVDFFFDKIITVENTADMHNTSTTRQLTPTQLNNTRSKDMSAVSSQTERNFDFFVDNSIKVDNAADINTTSTTNRISTPQHNNTRFKDISTVSSPTERSVDFFFDNSMNVDRFGGVAIDIPTPDLSIYTREQMNEINTNSSVADWTDTSGNGMWKSLADGSFDITKTMTSDGNLLATDSLRVNNSTTTDKDSSINAHTIIMTMLNSNQTWPGDNSVQLLNTDSNARNYHTSIHASTTISTEGAHNASDMLSADWTQKRNDWTHTKELLDHTVSAPFQTETETATASTINTNGMEFSNPVLKTKYNVDMQAHSANRGDILKQGTIYQSDIMLFNAPHVTNGNIKVETTKRTLLNSPSDSQMGRSMESLENKNMKLVSSRQQLMSKASERDAKGISLGANIGRPTLHMNMENTVQNTLAPITIRNTNKVESSSERLQSQSRQQVLKDPNSTKLTKMTTGPLRENKEIIGISLNGNSNVNRIPKSKDASLEKSDMLITPEHMPPISVRTTTKTIIPTNENAKIKTTKSENNVIPFTADTLKTQSKPFVSFEQMGMSRTNELNITPKGTPWRKHNIQDNNRVEPNDQILKTLEALVIELKAREKDDTVSPTASLFKPIQTTERTVPLKDDLLFGSPRYQVRDNKSRLTNNVDAITTGSRNNFVPFDIREELNIDTLQPRPTNPSLIFRNKQATNSVNSSRTSNNNSTFGTTDAIILSSSISSGHEPNSAKARQAGKDVSNVHNVKTISTNVQINKNVLVLPKEVQLLSKLNSKRKNQLTENMNAMNIDSHKYIEIPNDSTETIINFNTRQNMKTDLNVFPGDLQTISGMQYKESSSVNHSKRDTAERPSSLSLDSVRVKSSEGMQAHDPTPTLTTLLDSSLQYFNPRDLISIEGKYFIGQMRRNALGHFEPVPLASDIINTTPLPYSTIVESTYSIVNPTMSSNGRFMDKRQPLGKLSTMTIMDTPSDTFDLRRDSTSSYAIAETITPTRDPTSDVKPKLFYSQEQLLKELILPGPHNESKPVSKIFVSQDELLRSLKSTDLSNNFNTEFAEPDHLNDNTYAIRTQTQMLNEEPKRMTGINCPVDKVMVCQAVGINQYIPGMVLWCFSHCRYGVCPRDKCECTCEGVHYESSPLDKGKKAVQTKKIIELTLDGSKEKTVLVDKPNVVASNINISNVSNHFNERNAKKSIQRIENSTYLNVSNGEESLPLVKWVGLPNRVNGRKSDSHLDTSSSVTKYESQNRSPKSSGTITPTDILNAMYSRSAETMTSQSQYAANVQPTVINIIQNEKATPMPVIQVNDVSTANTLITNNEILAKVRSRDFTCIGINAFIGMDGINEWCTRLCKQDMCPLDICSCT